MNCEFCNNTFSSSYNLKTHQKSAKFCLKLQGQEIIKPDDNICEYCENSFSVKQSLDRHYLTCNVKKNRTEVDRLTKIIEEKNKHIIDHENFIISEFISNNVLFKTNSKIVKDFKLVLEDKSTIIIPIRGDGYVNVTLLCESVDKDINDWKKSNKKFINYLDDVDGNIFAHPIYALKISQWCSSLFVIQITKWLKELSNFVNEYIEDDDQKENDEKRISLDIQPYLFKDILYFFEFKPHTVNGKKILEDDNIHYFEFGVTSNIKQRQSGYGTGYRLDKVFVYDTGYKNSLAESYIKKIVEDLGLKFKYKNKKSKNKTECMKCTYSKLKEVYNLMLEHNLNSKQEYENEMLEVNIDIDADNFKIKKLQIEKETEIEKTNIKFKMLEDMFRDGKLSHEELKEYF